MRRQELIHLICQPLEQNINEHIKFRRTQLKNLTKMIRIDEIIKYLEKNPELIDKWTQYAFGKRGGSGYYLIMDDRIKEFGFYDRDSNISNAILKSKDPELVVAFFIIYDLKIHNIIFHTQ